MMEARPRPQQLPAAFPPSPYWGSHPILPPWRGYAPAVSRRRQPRPSCRRRSRGLETSVDLGVSCLARFQPKFFCKKSTMRSNASFTELGSKLARSWLLTRAQRIPCSRGNAQQSSTLQNRRNAHAAGRAYANQAAFRFVFIQYLCERCDEACAGSGKRMTDRDAAAFYIESRPVNGAQNARKPELIAAE